MSILFHVIYTPHTVQRLGFFAWSLLRLPEVRVRLVSNACTAEDEQFLKDFASLDVRFSFYRLPTDKLWRHGQALDHLVEVCDEAVFACIDSDILVCEGGHALELPPHVDAAFGYPPPVWWSNQPLSRLGYTYVMLYRRSSVLAIRQATGIGFSRYAWDDIPEPRQIEVEAVGLRYADYDTGKLLNAMLTVRGYTLGALDCDHLLHIGQYSSVIRNARIELSSSGSVANVETQSIAWWWGEAKFGLRHLALLAVIRRALKRVGKQWAIVYFERVLGAVQSGRSIPSIPWYMIGPSRRQIQPVLDEILRLHQEWIAAAGECSHKSQ